MTKESSIQIRRMLDNINKHLRALSTLGQSTDNWDSLLIYLLSSKLDRNTARAWEKERTGNEIPTLEDFTKFLKNRANLLETLEINDSRLNQDSKSRFENKGNFQSKKSFLAHKISCALCQEEHHIQDCAKFLSLTAQERSEKVRSFKLCVNCLRPGHFQRECRSKGCKRCESRHNSLLHFEKSKPSTLDTPSESREKLMFSTNSITSNSDDGVLSTVSVFAKNDKNEQCSARLLLDSGSQCNLITAELCDQLKLKKTPIEVNLGSISDCPLAVSHKCETEIVSRNTPLKIRVSCLVVPRIRSEVPKLPFNINLLQIPSHIKLADPNYDKPRRIDIFLGNAIFWSLICIGQIKLNNEGLVLQKTRLGWILAGPMPGPQSKLVSCNLINEIKVEDQLTKFWELEGALNKTILSFEENACEEFFAKTVKRNEESRFIVSIPLKYDPQKLGDSKEYAKRRLYNLEKKLTKYPQTQREYSKFMNEYISLGHMKRVDSNINPNTSYYLPHHCVFRPESLSTKLRVVFDASAATSSGLSLNDIQMVGPNIQSDLFSILTTFRKHEFIIGADIEKMYRQVAITPQQTSLQRILWRFDSNDFIEEFELTTVTYGTAAASFLAIRCLMELASECEKADPEVAKIIRQDFYVDDLLTGANTIEEASSLANRIRQVLDTGCFNLRKWVSNSSQIINKLTESQEDSNLVNLSADEQIKTLGLVWQTNLDVLKYSVNISSSSKVTKTQILAEIAQIFDPLGLVSPCIIIAKMLLQRLRLEKLSWDESLPYELHAQWLNYKKRLPSLNDLSVPRQVICSNVINIQLHGFSDASQNTYGGCVYLRSQNICGQITVKLLCSKSKVAPLKTQTQTIPKLELCGAVLLAKLCNKVEQVLDRSINEMIYWTDSTIVLGWIKNTNKNPNDTFTLNRVSQIRELTDIECWRHVPTKSNPADYLSRGVTPNQITDLKLWWSGPNLLYKDKTEWPIPEAFAVESSNPKNAVYAKKETRETTLVDDSIIKRFKNLSRLIRVCAYCKRFARNCKLKDNKVNGPLNTSELRESLLSLAQLSQRASFHIEINLLTDNKPITKGKLSFLNPFLDEADVLRVGGRLENSNFNKNKKHPIVIDSNHAFAKLLFQQEHIKLLHAAPQLLLANIRETFWPIGGRNLARKTVHDCIRCSRVKPKSMSPMMGNLPLSRVSPSPPPFYNTGVDYAGPFSIKDRKGRGCKISKAYVCLFVCFTTKALHLELVSDATAEAFIAALRRFASRRGKPANIFSDNGTNFVGENNELERLGNFFIQESEALSESISNIGIQWHFIPAYAPHFGGIWEAGVKSVKHHLKRVAGDAIMTYEEFATLLTQIEATLNSRPLTPLSTDPNDLSPLTPAHFLIGRIFTSVADPYLTHLKEGRLSNWQRIQQLQQNLWSRWNKEYISELQRRTKWKEPYPTIKKGTIVLLKEDKTPPSSWKLGRIVDFHPGKDGIPRIASVRTAKDTVRRAFTKLCPLPDCD